MKEYNINGSVVNIVLDNDKVVKASTDFIKKMQDNLDITEYDAVMTWLEDNDYIEIPEEQAELNDKAKASKVVLKAKATSSTPKAKVKKAPKENPTKENIITQVSKALEDIATDIVIENKTKVITFKIGEEDFKIDLTQKRKPKA